MVRVRDWCWMASIWFKRFFASISFESQTFWTFVQTEQIFDKEIKCQIFLPTLDLSVSIFILARRLPDGQDRADKIKSRRSPTIQIWRLKIGHVQRIKVDRDDSPILAEWTLGLQLSLNLPARSQLAKVFSRVFHNTLSRVFDNTFAKAFSEYFLRNFQNNFHLFSQNIFPRVFLSFSCVDTCLDLGACLSQCTNFQSRIFNTREENCQKIVVLSND